MTPHLRNPNPAKAVIRILCTGLIRNLRRIATGGGLVGSPRRPRRGSARQDCPLSNDRAPASRIRSTTVASMSGMYPSSVADPFIMGTPASMILSLSATVLPASLPAGPAHLGRSSLRTMRCESFPLPPGDSRGCGDNGRPAERQAWRPQRCKRCRLAASAQ